MSQNWGDRNCGNTGDKEQEHQSDQPSTCHRSIRELTPNEHAPDRRNHRCPLTDGVLNGWPYDLRVGSHEIKHRSRTPDDTANDSPPVPRAFSFEIVAHAYRSSASQRFAH